MQNKTPKNLAPIDHWMKGYSSQKYKKHSSDDPVYKFIREYAKNDGGNNSVLEIGSYLGTYISEFGELGHVLNGIDLHPENSKALVEWLKSNQYKIGNYYSDDLFSINLKEKFDIVCSFGFIEHFTNYLEIIDYHDRVLRSEGLLMITTPNYRGFIQKVMHKYLSPNDYALHYIPSMNPKKWAKHLEEKGYEIIFKGYFGGMSFWIGNSELTPLKGMFYQIFMRILPLIGKLIPFESFLFSKNCGIVARKK
jgi:2-polyprenyl-3-methyl-5-hydroxy-6-metoxy-1,4-benzoquinol methylase